MATKIDGLRSVASLGVALNPAVTLCLQGSISPQVALSRMLLGGMDASQIEQDVALSRPLSPTTEWSALARLAAERAVDLDRLASEIRRTGSDHSAVGGIAGIARFFDNAARFWPEAGVALYSLGDKATLNRATDEIVLWLLAQGAIPSQAAVLDFGCGIGRIAAALAPSCQSILGLDVSPVIIAEATRRFGSISGLPLDVTSGDSIPTGLFDLVLFVDSMPYVHQVGLADLIMAQCRSALKPGRAIAVLNVSYGRSLEGDRHDAERWGQHHELGLTISHPF